MRDEKGMLTSLEEVSDESDEVACWPTEFRVDEAAQVHV